MKIAFFVSKFPALTQTFILRKVTGLIDRGHEIDIYAASPKPDPTVHHDVRAYNLLDHVRYFRPQGQHSKVAHLMKGFPNMLRYPVGAIRIFKYGGGKEALKLLYYKTNFLDKELSYDIIHSHFGPFGLLASYLRDCGVIEGKLVTSFYGHDISRYLMKNGEDVYDELFRNGDLFLPISGYFKKRLIELGCDEAKVKVHRMGISSADFPFTVRTLSEDEPVRLLSIARLVEKKGIVYSLRAFARLIRQFDLEYRIVGDGPLRQRIENLIADLGISDRVKLMGWLQQEEVAELLNDTHILVAPSVVGPEGDIEGIPNALIEAQAMGVPVVTTYHSGIPELVQDGKSGYLVPERDVDALTDRLGHLVDNPDLWPAMGKAGRAHVEKKYDIEKLNDQLVEHYRYLVSGEEASENNNG